MSKIDWDSPEIAERYDKNSDHQFQKGVALMGMMKIKAGDAVLDIGCGTGRQAMNVVGIIGRSGKLEGVDPSSFRINLASEKQQNASIDNAHFQVGRAEDLSVFSDNTFDHAYFCSSFHWVDDKPAALLEVRRVLKPGGSVGMTTLDRESNFTMREITKKAFARHNCPVPDGLWDDGGMKRVTKGELEVLFEEAGFKEIHIEPRATNRRHKSLDEVLAFQSSNMAGGHLKDIPEPLKLAIRKDIMEELEKRRTSAGIELPSYTLFAMAVKP
jgi:ubiquinone/menaquinone biosynthesis C-methylase UbiE